MPYFILTGCEEHLEEHVPLALERALPEVAGQVDALAAKVAAVEAASRRQTLFRDGLHVLGVRSVEAGQDALGVA